jgi:hypothetical protein
MLISTFIFNPFNVLILFKSSRKLFEFCTFGFTKSKIHLCYEDTIN